MTNQVSIDSEKVLEEKKQSFLSALEEEKSLVGETKEFLTLLAPQFAYFYRQFQELDIKVEVRKLSVFTVDRLNEIGEHETEKISGNTSLLSVTDLKETMESENEEVQKDKSIYFIGLLKFLHPNIGITDSKLKGILKLDALYQGWIESCANFSQGMSNTSDEFRFFDVLSNVIDDGNQVVISDMFMSGDVQLLFSALLSKQVLESELISLLDMADSNYRLKKTNAQSNLGGMQNIMLNWKTRQNPTRIELEWFFQQLDYLPIDDKHKSLPSYAEDARRIKSEYIANPNVPIEDRPIQKTY